MTPIPSHPRAAPPARVPALAAAALAATLLAAAAATPAAARAQEAQVTRQQFGFIGTRLDIRVDVDAPGTLRLIRGEPGTIRVAGRAQGGFTSGGLADGGRLTLSAVGDGPVDYLVTVPENVWVDVRIPGWSAGRSVGRGEGGRWEWSAADRSPETPVTEWFPGLDPDGGWSDALYTTFTRDVAPLEVSVPDLSVIRRLSVRVEGHRFKVIAGRPLGVDPGSADHLVIRPAGPPLDLVLAVPAFAETFTLRLGGATALVLDGATVTTLCAPVTEQSLSNGRRWFTFNPLAGSLQCGSDTVRRHGG